MHAVKNRAWDHPVTGLGCVVHVHHGYLAAAWQWNASWSCLSQWHWTNEGVPGRWDLVWLDQAPAGASSSQPQPAQEPSDQLRC
jgi:hypothetical protein